MLWQFDFIIFYTPKYHRNIGLFMPPFLYYLEKPLMFLLAAGGILYHQNRITRRSFIIIGIIVQVPLILRIVLNFLIFIPTPIAFVFGLYYLRRVPEGRRLGETGIDL